MIVAGCIYYRSGAECLERLLGSLVGRVEGVVMLDGPYEGVSRDVATRRPERDVIKSFKRRLEVVSLQSAVYPSEPVKRTVCSRLAHAKWPHATRLLVIDSDEELLTPIQVVSSGQVGLAKIIDPDWSEDRRLCMMPVGGWKELDELGWKGVRPGSQRCLNDQGLDCDCPTIRDATMIRLHHLTNDLSWGPSHYEVTCRGVRYTTPHSLPDVAHVCTIKHHGVKNRSKAYTRYNDLARLEIEHAADEPPTWSYASRPETIYTNILDG